MKGTFQDKVGDGGVLCPLLTMDRALSAQREGEFAGGARMGPVQSLGG